ncbi:hypothetical protein BofuT4_P035240.1 [Botrytis cinerea T4]|uniref:Uncharacterized protein n=1 Tax=Botryotinia fuckeliana (strain T4) TaxID=999810 RepID=G2Y6H9_BOTF4|nr:hypothetical protein BofuT4_P035240.1 [Botrytis cinerea T4]
MYKDTKKFLHTCPHRQIVSQSKLSLFLPTPFKNEQTNTSNTFDLLIHQQLELQQLSIHNFLSLQILQTNQLHYSATLSSFGKSQTTLAITTTPSGASSAKA